MWLALTVFNARLCATIYRSSLSDLLYRLVSLSVCLSVCRQAVGWSRILDWRASTTRWTQRLVHVRPVEVDGLVRTHARNYCRIHRVHSWQTGQVSHIGCTVSAYSAVQNNIRTLWYCRFKSNYAAMKSLTASSLLFRPYFFSPCLILLFIFPPCSTPSSLVSHFLLILITSLPPSLPVFTDEAFPRPFFPPRILQSP